MTVRTRRHLRAVPGPWRTAILVLLLASVLAACGPGEERPAPDPGSDGYDADGARAEAVGTPEVRPNLVVVVLDTLRADAVTGSSGRPGVMPYLAGLGQKGTEFRRAVAPASWTMPSLASFLTGLAPHDHRLVDLSARVDVPRTVTTFAEALGRGYGYETAAFVGLAPHAISSSVFDGFSGVTSEFSLQAVEPVVVPWARRRDARRPFLLLLHTYDVHEPYGRENQGWPRQGLEDAFADGNPLASAGSDPWEVTRRCLLDWRACRALRSPRNRALQDAYLSTLWSGLARDPQPELVEELRRAYEAGAAWVDGLLANTVARLERLGLLQNTLLVVTSDHGEAFGEHGILLHGRQLYGELVHIPLVVVPFGVAGSPFAGPRAVEGCVGLADVFPTLFEALRLAPVGQRQGRSFLGASSAGSEGPPVHSEVRVTPEVTGGEADQQVMSARSSAWCYLLTCDFRKGAVAEELYDLRQDPGELRPVPLHSVDAARLGPELVRAIESVRDHFWRGPDALTVTCDLPGSPETPVRVPRPAPFRSAVPTR